ncbi:MAG: diadenylate cyclase CdaA [bacterium]
MSLSILGAYWQAIWGGSFAAMTIQILDLAVVYFLIYRLLVLVKGTKSMQILSGFFALLLLYFLGNFFGLRATSWLLNGLFANFFIIIILLFHEEIRTILSGFEFFDIFKSSGKNKESFSIVDEITEALVYLASVPEGAIIVISQKGNPESFVSGGVKIDANIKRELLLTIFKKSSPLHDGAVIIRDGRISLASAVLPLSTNPDIDPNFGTRHRAAYGISEVVDCIVFVVSEESGQISMFSKGKITRNISRDIAKRMLSAHLAKEKK